MNEHEKQEIRRAIEDIQRAKDGFQGPFALVDAKERLLKLLSEDAKETISVWVVRTNGFGGGKVFSTELTSQHVVMQLNFPHEANTDISYFTKEEYARTHLADYIKYHSANQPIKEASE